MSESNDSQPKEEQQQPKQQGEAWYSAPSTYGNKAGDAISSTLGKVGQPVGKGISYGTAPVGNVVDSLVGGVMRSGDLANDAPEHGEKVEKKIGDKVGEGQKALGEAAGQGQEGQAARKGEQEGKEAVRSGEEMADRQKGEEGGEAEGKGKIEMRDEGE